MSKGGKPTEGTRTALAVQRSLRDYVKARQVEGATREQIEAEIVTTPEQARLIVSWANQ